MKLILAMSAALLLSPIVVTAAEASKTKIIQTPNEPVAVVKKTVDPIPQKIELASAKQVAAMNAVAAQAKGFVAAYLHGKSNPLLSDFDAAFRLWQREKPRRYTEEQVMEMLGLTWETSLSPTSRWNGSSYRINMAPITLSEQ